MSEPRLMFSKILFCERYVELREYQRPFNVYLPTINKVKNDRKRYIPPDYEIITGLPVYNRRSDSLSRTRSKVHQLISCNIEYYPKFLTLTCRKSVLDYDVFLYQLKQFFKNMKRKGFNLRYLWVAEHQTERGIKEGNEGSYHAHIIIFNDEFIPFEIINSCWDGNTDIHIFEGLKWINGKPTDEAIKNVASYVVKYITKDNLNEFGKNCYHCSRGLNRPIEIRQYMYGGYDQYGNLKQVYPDKVNNKAFDYFKDNMKIYDVKSFITPIFTENYSGYVCCQVSLGKVDNMYETNNS